MSKLTRFLFLQIILLLTASFCVFAQHEKKVDGVQIKNTILTIASPEYMGRETGTKGCTMAEEYIAEKFKELKLKPLGDKDSYFYTYNLSFYRIEGDLSLVIGDRTYYYGRNEDYTLERFSDGGKVSGEIVFAGYGLISTEKKRNDFSNLDLKGKIVIVRKGCPNSEWEKWGEVATDSAKATYCYKNGAIGMLTYEPTQMNQQMGMPMQRPAVMNSLPVYNQIKNFPVFKVDERVVRYCLENATPNYQNISRGLDMKPMSCNTDKKASMSAKVTYDREKKVRDVLAMIPGTDSKLKDQAIVIGGHLDHLGIDVNGKMFPGADDNASGPAVALAVADAMVKNKFKPKRTIIFAAWTGEEKGLLGSQAWCENPTWDMNKIVVYFNLDMVGLGDVKLGFPGTYYAADVWKFLKENSDTSYLNGLNPTKGGPGGSDHTPFLQKGVSAFAGMTEGQHPDYHQYGDTPEKISVDVVQFVGDWMYHCIEILANSKNDFLPPNRNIDNKFRLASINNTYPLGYSDYKNVLAGKDIDFSLINLSEKMDAKNPDQNFVAALKLLDETNRPDPMSKDYSFVQNLNDMRFMGFRGASPIMASVDLSLFGYSGIYCKTLAKAGAKVGFIGKGSPFEKDKFDKSRTLNNIADAGMAIILNDPSTEEILNISEQLDRPVGIISAGTDVLTEDVIQKMKSKGSVFLLGFSLNTPVDEIIKNVETLKSKVGESSVALYPQTLDEAMFKKIKELYIALDKKNYSGNFASRIFGENFSMFLNKALQEKQQRAPMGRPF
jgi:aminopeptidase YwaD